MNEISGFIIDIVNRLVQGFLIVYLMRGTIKSEGNIFRFSFIDPKWVSAIIVLQNVVYHIAMNYYPPVQRIFYGNDMIPLDSRNSIPAMLMGIVFTLIFCFLFFGRKIKEIFYLIFLINTFNELIKFGLYTFFIRMLQAPFSYIVKLVEQGNTFALKNHEILFYIVQIIWNLIFIAALLVIPYHALKFMKKLLLFHGERQYSRTEMIFLYVPVVLGLCFCILFRSILFFTRERILYLVLDQYPEMHILIPIISILCILLIYFSAFVLKRLILSSENEILIETYKNRMTDMEAHIKDVEHLYDGIRGMKHDMKNYVADMDALMKNTEFNPEQCSEEVKKYLDGMCETLEQLDMKYSTGNPVTDIVINRKLNEAEKENIPFECNFLFPEYIGISAFDLSIILNNSLENALEASLADRDHSYIIVDSYIRENMFFLEVRNYIGNHAEVNKSHIRTTKKEDVENHGFGLKNIRSCVEKYFGKAEYFVTGHEFTLSVMLQGKRVE